MFMKRLGILFWVVMVVSQAVFAEADISVDSKIEYDKVVLIKASRKDQYDWLYYIGSNVDRSTPVTIFVTGLNGNKISEDYNIISEETTKLFNSRIKDYHNEKLVYVCPIIPRNPTNYTVSLNRLSVSSQKGKYYRPDLKLNDIIDTFRVMLEKVEYKTNQRILLEGFSAGGMFAQRYSLIHPEKVKGIIVGQAGGHLVLPVLDVINKKAKWPVGIYDFESIFQKKFNFEEYKLIKQRIYIGALDTNNSTVKIGNNDIFTDSEISLLKRVYGEDDPVRLKNESDLLVSIGCDVEFKLYEDTPHRPTMLTVFDNRKFIEKLLLEE